MFDHGGDGDNFSLEAPADLIEWADMGFDFMERGIAQSLSFGQSGAKKILSTRDEAYADQIVGFTGEDQADTVSEEHEIVDCIGYFEHFDFTPSLAASTVFIEFGHIELKTVFEGVHKFDGTLFQHMVRIEVILHMNDSGFVHVNLLHGQIFYPFGREIQGNDIFLHTSIVTQKKHGSRKKFFSQIIRRPCNRTDLTRFY